MTWRWLIDPTVTFYLAYAFYLMVPFLLTRDWR